jgi:thiamine kinase-like enzyme
MATDRQTPEQLVRRLSLWKGPITLEVLKGGVSNASFLVTDATGRYVARLGEDYPFHQVFRDTELAASLAAHEAGLSPEVVYSETGVMVVRFVAAKTYGEADVRANAVRCIEMVKRCHHDMARRVRGRVGFFWVFQVVRSYLRELAEKNHAQAVNALQWGKALDRLEQAQEPLPIVFGHHDLLPTNFLDDGRRLWLIDWEYGGFGTCMFDLANISANNQFTDENDAMLLETYFERPPGDAIMRSFYAMKCASALREATWGMVSELHLAATGIDYVVYANEFLGRYARALAGFTERFGDSR